VIEYLFALSGILALAALVRGPTFADRALAGGVFFHITIMLLLLFAVRSGSFLFFDVSVVIIFMGFVGTLAIARYARRKR
jgi:multicomponent K+:H+ antiporter subunit F